MSKEHDPAQARTWVGEPARQILAQGEELLSAARAFLSQAKAITAAVDKAAEASATTLSMPSGTVKGATSPLDGQIALTLEIAGQRSPHLVTVVAAHTQEKRAAELRPDASATARRLDQLLDQARPTAGRLRFALHGKERKAKGVRAIQELKDALAQATTAQLQPAFAAFAAITVDTGSPEQEAFALDRMATVLRRQAPTASPRTVGGADLVVAQTLGRAGRIALTQRPGLMEAVRKSFNAVQDRMVDRQLRDLPVERLKDATDGRIRFKTLGTAKIATVYDVLHFGGSMSSIPGISDMGAQQVLAAAMQVAKAVRDDLQFRIDLDKTDQLVTDLLSALHTLLVFDSSFDGNAEQLQQATDYLAPLLSLPAASTAVTLLGTAGGGADARLAQIHTWVAWGRRGDILAALERATQPTAAKAQPAEVWTDFEKRSAAYYALLGQLVDLKLDVDAAAGFLPQSIVDRIHEQQLDESFLRVSLRGYQSFGARYALVQRKVILGDEMGLGKTVQAIAVMAHLQATGHTHYLVVCPASVLINWTREVQKHSKLRPYQVHGSDRDRTWRNWQKLGGVAITTFDTLRTLNIAKATIALLTVDEAHFVKNPNTLRAKAVISYVNTCERTLFMTGTPMENRVEEFRQLVSYLQPAVAKRIAGTDGFISARKFREGVAPVYLRRNTDDVLQELPPLVQVEEWLEFTSAEVRGYRDAVGSGNFMAMRQVGFLADPTGSTKLARLVELCEESAANGHKVIVFSYFRQVLDNVAAALGARAVGPLTGGVSAAGRQQLVDEFTNAPASAVMVSQIQAGGVGLNMQAGSVVILCEPQVKPSLEAQAIARAHRMGQVRSVQVHRLLTADSVDQRMLDILDSKQQLFDEYARGSDIADASPEAVDVSEKSLARQVVEQEQERFALQMVEEFAAKQG